MKEVRFGIVGLGSMGWVHAQTLLDGKVPRATLTAVCDTEVDLTPLSSTAAFTSSAELIRSGLVDAVLVATPHYSHTSIGIDVLSRGLHLLLEKPISVHKADCQQLIAAHTGPAQIFAAMFNQRTDGIYTRLRSMVRGGELGKIHRMNWIITNWFRSQAYYNSSEWRATWAGEGGGVLLNQCPHNLDLLQWIFGMPSSVRAYCRTGYYHDIEVEDDVTARLEYPDGATGVFITATGEAPGTNRLEIAAEHGRVVMEGGKIIWDRLETPVSAYSRTTRERWAAPPATREEIEPDPPGEQHLGILKNFVAAILDSSPLIAPAAEGMRSVELANAMIYSSHTGQDVPLPLDARAYATFLDGKIASSQKKKNVVKMYGPRDLANSFGKA